MSLIDSNPRATPGDNTQAIDYAGEETKRLLRDYADFDTNVAELLEEAAKVTVPIADDAEKGTVVDLIKRLRDMGKRLAGIHEVEKQPHYRRGQAVDQFFFGLIDTLAKREKRNRNGAADTLGEALTAYDVRKLAEEQERRRLELEAAEREAARLRKIEEDKAREAEEARLAAERARKPETTAAKVEIADAAEQGASSARVETVVAEAAAEEKYVATLARPADIMRTRTAGGTMSTMAEVNYAEVVDATKLDMAKLWPFIKLEAKEQALRAWANNTGHREQMAGASIGKRPKSQVR